MKLRFALFVAIASCAAQHINAQGKFQARVNHLAVYVTDLMQSREFYTQVIGLDTIAEPFHDGKHAWLSMGMGTSLHIIAGADKKKEYYQNNHLCLSIPNMEEFRKLLERKKIAWYNAAGEKGKITTRVDGVTQLWIQDPDGYWIEMNNDVKALNKK